MNKDSMDNYLTDREKSEFANVSSLNISNERIIEFLNKINNKNDNEIAKILYNNTYDNNTFKYYMIKEDIEKYRRIEKIRKHIELKYFAINGLFLFILFYFIYLAIVIGVIYILKKSGIYNPFIVLILLVVGLALFLVPIINIYLIYACIKNTIAEKDFFESMPIPSLIISSFLIIILQPTLFSYYTQNTFHSLIYYIKMYLQ